jgi:hypothetical protein
MTTEEAIEEIRKAKAEGREIELADSNPHWWMGCRANGTLWWSYDDGDDSERWDYQEFKTAEELQDVAGDGDWHILPNVKITDGVGNHPTEG